MRAFAFPFLVASAALCLMAGGAARAQSGTEADTASYSEAVELVRHAAGNPSTVEEDFNVRYMGLLALGTHRRDLDAETLGAFDELFGGYLAARYVALLNAPGDASVKITGVEPAGPRDAVVSTRIEGRGSSVLADWRVRDFGGRPQIIDVSAAGASLVDLQRAEIAQWLKDGGAKGLLDQMRAAAGEGT